MTATVNLTAEEIAEIQSLTNESDVSLSNPRRWLSMSVMLDGRS